MHYKGSEMQDINFQRLQYMSTFEGKDVVLGTEINGHNPIGHNPGNK